MTSKREWKRRALAAEGGQVKFIDGYRVATPLLSRDASGRVTVDWDGKGDVVLMTIDTHNERIDAIAERDRARDCAAALESDCALLAESLAVLIRNVRDTAELERISISEAALAHARALVLPANTSASPTPESIMRDFDALEATGWLGP